MSINYSVTRRQFLTWAGALGAARCWPAWAQVATQVVPQTYFAQVNHALEELAKMGASIAAADAKQISALAQRDDRDAVDETERILNRYTLASLLVSSEVTRRVVQGAAPRTLKEQGWRTFLVRVVNPTGRKETIALSTSRTPFPEGPGRIQPFPSAGWDDHHPPGTDPQLDGQAAATIIKDMWVLSELSETTLITYGGVEIPTVRLSGLPIEYRAIQLFSRNDGRRIANLTFYTLPDTSTFPSVSGHRQLDFDCVPARTVILSVRDTDGRGCTASLTIKDEAGRVYPPQLMRVVPDRFFHEQIYRSDGEIIRLSDGVYTIESVRGPEYLRVEQITTIDALHYHIDVQLQRWIDPAQWGFYSGDTHFHANCCVPYRIPEGVTPETMIREVRGEGLAVGDVLLYGLGWSYQAKFFRASTQSPAASLEHPELQTANNTSLRPHATPEDPESSLHYDIETSVFPAEHSGHLVLLHLKTLQYPGAKLTSDWPSWNLPILRWAKEQGGVAGYGHAGIGLAVASTDLPNYDIPTFNPIGNEAIVDATYGLVDFLGACEVNPLAELNVWYHMLNCGFRMALVGESDYPANTERPGVGRSYVRLEQRPVGEAGYDSWIRGMQLGRLYCGDGRSHFLDFRVNGRRNGEDDLAFEAPSKVTVEALVAARLEVQLTANGVSQTQTIDAWHLEKARIGATREVAVELVVNGVAVDKAILTADGTPRPITFKSLIVRSSWVALRILESAHTYPAFVEVGNKPTRASKRSARWCRACVDKLWEVTSPFVRESERTAASEAFDHAREAYDTIINESEVE